MDENAKQACLSLLRRIVSLWPKTEIRLAGPSAAMSTLLTNDFDPIDLTSTVSTVAEILDVQTRPGSVIVDFLDVDDTPHRAVFKQVVSNWKLQSLKFQCPVCFGTGTNDAKACIVCGGSGWGAS
jgi:hypothetical protein